MSPQPPQQASAGALAGWGLSDLSNLGVGLPPAQAPTAGASVVSGRGGAGVGLGFEGMPTNNDSVVDGGGGGGPLAGSGMMPMPQVQLDVYLGRAAGRCVCVSVCVLVRLSLEGVCW